MPISAEAQLTWGAIPTSFRIIDYQIADIPPNCWYCERRTGDTSKYKPIRLTKFPADWTGRQRGSQEWIRRLSWIQQQTVNIRSHDKMKAFIGDEHTTRKRLFSRLTSLHLQFTYLIRLSLIGQSLNYACTREKLIFIPLPVHQYMNVPSTHIC